MADAAGGVHQIYVTAHFEYTGAWAGETAQIGLRLGAVPMSPTPGRGSTFTPQVSNAAITVPEFGTDATWTYSVPWGVQYGGDAFHTTQMLAVANLYVDYWNAIKAEISGNVSMTSVKFAPILPTGKYQHPSAEFVLLSPIDGAGTAANTSPPELAIASSLRAPVLGRRGRGRWYIPSPSTQTYGQYSGKVRESTRIALGGAADDLVKGIETLGDSNLDFRLVVGVASATTATMVRPSEIRVGDHVDVQRRRQHQVEETYTVVSL